MTLIAESIADSASICALLARLMVLGALLPESGSWLDALARAPISRWHLLPSLKDARSRILERHTACLCVAAPAPETDYLPEPAK